jgi:moderate conductance mechanosensitive channel
MRFLIPKFSVNSLTKFFLIFILVFSLTFGYHSLASARFNLPIPTRRVQVFQIGNLEYAGVTLDGHELFKIASPLTPPDEPNKTVAQRVEQIENTLFLLINVGFDPTQLRVNPGILNGETVVLVSDGSALDHSPILTVTAADSQFHAKSITYLAQDFSEKLKEALLRAYSDRQPDFLREQAIKTIQVLIVTLLFSFGLILIQKYLHKKSKVLQQESVDTQQQLVTLNQRNNFDQGFPGKSAQALRLFTEKLQQITYTRKLNINSFLRQIVLGLQLALWLGSVSLMLQFFPDTRLIGIWLSNLPVKLLMVGLFVILINKGSDVLIDSYLKAWADDNAALDQNKLQRYSLRVPTFTAVIKGVSSFFVIIIGLLFTLEFLGIPIGPVLTGAGILGFAVSFASQSLIKDVINGCLILWEDQYAVGDVIKVGEAAGLVEYMNLRITQLRDLEGQLITIPNSQISIVRNLSSEWSRVNFAVEVGYDADLDQAIEVMKMVCDRLFNDPEWKDLILEQPEILGIDNIAHTGILIRLLIKTKPLQQWLVAREFRRRLKKAFDEKNIPIGIPQQSLWLKNSH